MIINPYLNFDGKTEEAFNFYKSIFGGEFTYLQRFKDIPVEEGQPPIPAEEAERIMHVSLPIGEHNTLMGSDISPSMGHTFTAGNSTQVSVHPNSLEEAERLFKKLSEGGKIEIELQKMFWGDHFAAFQDKFGIYWMVNFNEGS